MGKLAFMFPGQGTQYSGMGQAVSQAFSSAAAVFQLADTLRPGTSAQCFFGSEDTLKDTKNTQPCIFITELAIAAALTQRGLRPAGVAGYSLGELSALTYAGAFSLEVGFPLVCRRAELMTQAAAEHPGAMAAVRGLSTEEIDAICATLGDVYQVNFNCPGQSTVAGLPAQLPAFMQAVRDAGGSATPLAVSGGFHSLYMDSAAVSFEPLLRQAGMGQPTLPVYANVDGQPYHGDLAHTLARQINSPVLWQASVLQMAADGIDTFLEVGPGKTLSGFLQKILPQARVLRCDTPAQIDAVLHDLRP